MRNVLVTGCSKGLGLAIARRLTGVEDYRLIGLSRSISDEYRALMDANDALHYSFDAENIDQIPGLIRRITQDHGKIYGLVNNAGIGADGVLATMHSADIERVLKVNLQAPITLCKYASRSMMAAREGRIINISSIIASTGFHGLAAYAASKAGLEGLSRSLSRELGKRGVTVNCVAPGYMETDMTAGIDPHKLASIRGRAPLGLPQPEHAAEPVVYLLSKAAEKTTGTVITVDGGSTA